jgi:hypothetical protein
MRGITNQRFTLAVMTMLALIWAPGCGSNADDGGTSSLSKTQYITKGDQICKKRLEEKDKTVKAEFEKLSRSEIANPSKQTLEELGETIIPFYKEVIEELNDLPAPAKEKARAEKIIDDLEAGLRKAEAKPGSLASTDPFEGAAETARAYGFKSCNL